MKTDHTRRRGESTGRAERVPSKMTASEAAALRANWGTARLAEVQRNHIRCVVFLQKEEVAGMMADDVLCESIRYKGEGNQVLARGRALRLALRSYLARRARHGGAS